nr:MAG: putative RNA-dependent RNA polymerase [Narnaviridae sp.]
MPANEGRSGHRHGDGHHTVVVDYKVLKSEGFREDSLPPALLNVVNNYTPTDPSRAREELHRLVAVLMFVRSTWDTLCDADPVFRYCEEKDWFGFFDVLLQAPDDVMFVKWCKYLTCWPMAKFLRQELPKIPAGLEEALGGSNLHFPLRGGARRHFRNLLASRTSEVRPSQVMWAILQGVKRGCAEVPESFQAASMRDHQAALTQSLPELSPEDCERFRLKFRSVWRTARPWQGKDGKSWVAWGRSHKMTSDLREPANPGFNACFESTRGEGGRCGWVRRVFIDHLVKKGLLPGHVFNDSLVKMTEIRPGVVVEERVSRDFLPVIKPSLATKWAIEELKEFKQCHAEVAAILEPLKCRLITKGSGLPYFAAQPFQKAMWARLQEFACFKLTGCPLDASMLAGLVMQEKKLGLQFDKWVSGDYSAATDGLSQQINSLCLAEAMDGAGLTPDERTVASAVLGNHVIHYPAEFHGDLPAGKIQQKNGQLMGSVLSFPILCTINLAAYWIALEEYTGRKFVIEELPLLINGDDICFRANDEFYQIWKRWTAKAGFSLSQGKNYIAADFVTVNSEGYVYKPNKRAPSFHKCGYLNTGLLYSAKGCKKEVDWREDASRKVGMRTELRTAPFTAKVNWLLEGAVDPHRTLLRVHEHYREEIAFHTHRGEINMHAAPELGGLGICLPEGCTTRFTAWQQKVAGFLKSRWKTGEFGHRVPDSDGQWDLNRPMGLKGRLTYQNSTTPAARGVLPVRPGKVVARKRLEPCRADERVWALPTTRLMNYQSKRSKARGEWKICQLSREDLELCRSYSGPKVLEPLVWDEELREQFDGAEAPVGLVRTDTFSVPRFLKPSDPDTFFRTHPILEG